MSEDLGILLDEIRREEVRGDTSNLLLALNQGRRAANIKKLCPKTWKSDLQEHCSKAKSTWFQRLSIYRDFGVFLLPEIPDDHVSTLPSSLALLTQLTKGTDEKCRQAWLEQIAGLSFSDVKKLVKEAKGESVCECSEWEEVTIQRCKSCHKKRKEEDDGDIG
jgi:hypothetical protein